MINLKNLKKLTLLLLILFSCSKNKEEPKSQKTNKSKNYLNTSYHLSNYDLWINFNDVFSDGVKYTKDNPLLVIQTAQLDINMDGFEDIFTYDSYPLNIPTPKTTINSIREISASVQYPIIFKYPVCIYFIPKRLPFCSF